MPSEVIDQYMVRTIAQVAKALCKEVVAEFVQNEATVELLKGYGVDFVQAITWDGPGTYCRDSRCW